MLSGIIWPSGQVTFLDAAGGTVSADGRFPALWTTGAYKQVGFFVDNTFTDDAHTAQPSVKLRVAMKQNDGHWQTEHISVGKDAAVADSNEEVYVLFDKPNMVRAMSVTREDDSVLAVAFMVN